MNDRRDALCEVLDWLIDEQLRGRSPTDADVAKRFDISIEGASTIIHDLEMAGELRRLVYLPKVEI